MFFVIVKKWRDLTHSQDAQTSSLSLKHEYAPVQIFYPQSKIVYFRMDERDLHLWGNLFRKCEAVF